MYEGKRETPSRILVKMKREEALFRWRNDTLDTDLKDRRLIRMRQFERTNQKDVTPR